MRVDPTTTDIHDLTDAEARRAESERCYAIGARDERLVWIEAGTDPDAPARKLIAACAKGGRNPWHEVDGHRWAWVGKGFGCSRFTWQEARDIVWNKLKTSTHCFGVLRPTPIADRWAHTLIRIVPRGDKIRPKGAR